MKQIIALVLQIAWFFIKKMGDNSEETKKVKAEVKEMIKDAKKIKDKKERANKLIDIANAVRLHK